MDALSSAARQHYQAMLDGDRRGARDSEGRAAEEGEEERREGKSGRGQSDPAPKKAAGAFDNTVKTIGAAWAQVTTPLKSWATPLAAGAVDACPDPLKNAIGTCKDGLAKGVERVGSSVSRVVSETRHSELQRDAVADCSSPGAVPGDSEESHDAQTARAGSLGVCAFVSSLCLCIFPLFASKHFAATCFLAAELCVVSFAAMQPAHECSRTQRVRSREKT